MFGFGKHAPDARCGLIVDIGSSSIALAIVVSEIDELQPTIVWTHTEHTPIVADYTLANAGKRIIAALTSVSLEAGGPGLVALAKHDARLRITDTQVSIAAPWSYTVPKKVSYRGDEDFVATASLVEELKETAERETIEQHNNLDLFASLGLETLSGETTQWLANGYAVQDPTGQTVRELTLVHNIAIAQKQLVEAVREVHRTIVPHSSLTITSYMQHMRQNVLANTITEHTYGLIDVSGDATEVGVVNNGHLAAVINNQWGVNSLVRELSIITQQPTSSALALVQASTDGNIAGLHDSQQSAWEAVCDTFIQTQSDIIARAAIAAEQPEHYVVHADSSVRSFVLHLMSAAITKNNASSTVSLVSEKLLEVVTLDETRLALAVAVFHTNTCT